MQVLNNILLFGMTPQDPIDAPRLGRMPDGTLAIEDRVSQDVLDALRAPGYNVDPRSGWAATFGGEQAILVRPVDRCHALGSRPPAGGIHAGVLRT